MEYHFQCIQCGKPFSSRQKRSRSFCSHDCYHAAQVGKVRPAMQKRIIKQCVVCGSDFKTGGGLGKRTRQFCSSECAYRGRYRHGLRCKELTSNEAAYLAGFIDGEGSIMLNYDREVAAIRLTATNTHKGVLEWIKSTTGIGTINYRKRFNEKHKETWFWVCHSEGAISVIEQVRPYLIVKGVQADLAIETDQRLRDPALKADRSWHTEYVNRMKLLNRRGSVPADEI